MTGQILWGSVFLGICATIHLTLIVWWVEYLRSRAADFGMKSSFMQVLVPIGGTFTVLIASHTVQVWVWALAFIGLEALPNLVQAIYFSLVTYTTLGYGDVILADDHKIFGAMESVTGLLNFGVSTAVLISVISKVLPKPFSDA